MIEGIEGSITAIRRVQNRADDTPAIYRKIGTFMRKVYLTQFSSQGAFLLGDPWQPLKPGYRRWKMKHSHSGRILVLNGDLRSSYTRKYAAYESITPTGAEYGSSNRLAPFHEFGTHSHTTGKPIVPARPVAVANKYVKDGVSNIIADYITQQKKTPEGGEA